MKRKITAIGAIAIISIVWGGFCLLFPIGYGSIEFARKEYASIYREGQVVYSEENKGVGSLFDFVIKDDNLYVIRLNFIETITGKRYREWGHYRVHVSGLMQESAQNIEAYENNGALLFHNEVADSLTGDSDAVTRAVQWSIVESDQEIPMIEGISVHPFSCAGESFVLYVKTDSTVRYSRIPSAFSYAFIAVGVFFGFFALYFFVLEKQYKRVIAAYNAGEYQKAAEGAERSIAVLLRKSVRKPNYDRALLVKALDERYLILAVSRYAEGDKEGFLESIGKVQGLEVEKNLWLTIYYLIDGDLVQSQTQYTVLCSIPTFDKEKIPALDGLLLLKKGEDEKALPILRNAVKSIHHPLLRRIVEQTLNSKK